MRNAIITIFLSFFMIACGTSPSSEKSTNEAVEALSRRDQMRYKQYMVQGVKIYKTYCNNCHQQNGKGLASLYPPLAASDYLLENIPRAACIIKNGQNGEIMVNGTTYNQMMPAAPLSNLEIAEVLTYIGNSWGNTAGLIGVKEVDKWVKECDQ